MHRFHVGDTRGRSGIARYTEVFHRVALADAGYTHLQPDQAAAAMAATRGGQDATWHLQLGANQVGELAAYRQLVRAGCTRIDVTLHEPPFLAFPFFRFGSHRANTLSRGFDWYLDSLGIQRRLLRASRRIFVLSRKGAEALRQRHGIDRAVVIPMAVDPASIWERGPAPEVRDLLFFGFIGRAKGLEYALALHASIRQAIPGVAMHVVGETLSDRDQRGLEALKARYADGVHYHGYVPEADLDTLFARTAHVLLPFAAYRYFVPTSASTLGGLARGRVVWVSDVNAIRETVRHGENGMLLSGDPSRDRDAFLALEGDPERRRALAEGALETARAMARFDHASLFREP